MWRWVVIGGLAALTALWAFASFWATNMPGLQGAPVIQERLRVSAARALTQAGATWAQVEMRGQTAYVSGLARTEEERDFAIAAVRRAGWDGYDFQSGLLHTFVYYVYGPETARNLKPGGPFWGGVVEVLDRTELAPIQSPFTWNATIIEGRKLRISGFAPSETARADLLKQAQSLFPSGVEDQSTVARGAPKGNWPAAVGWGLISLERLGEGSELNFADSQFVLRGVTDNPALPGVLKERVAQVVAPFAGETDIALVGEQVPPAVTPAPLNISVFTWSARVDANKHLQITGYAPSETVRAAILQSAQQSFGSSVDDRSQIATLGPEGDWPAAVNWALRLLTKLDSGEAAFTGNRMMITGVAARPDIQTFVTNGARQITEPYTGDAVILLPGEQAPAPSPAPAPTPTPAPPAPAAPPIPAPAPAAPPQPQEPEAANRSESAVACQGIVDSVMANQVIAFDSGRTLIKGSSFALLDQIAATALQCPGLKLIVAGHTDNSGSQDSNRKLSQDRARSVVAYLRNKGVANGRMIARGYGPDRPIASNDTDEGKARNRRIQITITD